MINNKSVAQNIHDEYENLFSAEKKVADYVISNPEGTVTMNVSQLAQLSGVSDATVVRMCKRVGYEGYYQMKIFLSNDIGKNQITGLQNAKEQPENINDIMQNIISNLLHTASLLDSAEILSCLELIKKSKTVYVVATGNTIPVAMDMAFRLCRTGINAISNVVPEYSINNISYASKEDLVIGITHSGSSKQVMQAFELAKERGIPTIAITNSPVSPVSRIVTKQLCTNLKNPLFKGEKRTSRIYEMAIIDIIIYFLVNEYVDGNNFDEIDLLLSVYKL